MGAAKAVQAAETARLAGQRPEEAHAGVAAARAQAKALRPELDSLATGIGSLVYACLLYTSFGLLRAGLGWW